MSGAFNFRIQDTGEISREFLSRRITDFQHAAQFIRELPYRRNTDKTNLVSVFADGGATCGPKHAVLRQLALENGIPDLKLKLGIFRMNGLNTPAVASTLAQYGLAFLPEVHNYLRVHRTVLDCTRPNSSADDFRADLLLELEIEPTQIGDAKVAFHQTYLRYWLHQNPGLGLTLPQLWSIREQCIEALSREP
ncbi:hypothetical protein IC235_12550 [Hymenobacter sp. BT664]|uniref:Uncharacterized protein n=1 Tax=Hymenobacter montanus TaxID=2771359 RepID=A0A927GK28_9BACT|nr:hypothetical protein [Hymenobacter montanus]MBD2768716.1 hypothetical protein [Hymenobacter montanus]